MERSRSLDQRPTAGLKGWPLCPARLWSFFFSLTFGSACQPRLERHCPRIDRSAALNSLIQFAGVIQLAGLAQYELKVRVAQRGIITVASMVRHFVVIGLSKSAHDATKLSESAETTRHTVDTSIAAAVYVPYVA